jgi:hypothetical protein
MRIGVAQHGHPRSNRPGKIEMRTQHDFSVGDTCGLRLTARNEREAGNSRNNYMSY